MKAQRWSRGVALHFLTLGARQRWVVNATPRLLYLREGDPVAIVQEAGWAPGLVSAGAGNLAHTGIRSPDSPARSKSLYRLCYPSVEIK